MAAVVTVHGAWIPARRDGVPRRRLAVADLVGACGLDALVQIPGPRPAPIDGVGIRPRSVRRWTNIIAVNDPVAAGRPLDTVYPGAVGVAVHNGHRAHDPAPYVCSAACGRSVAEGVR